MNERHEWKHEISYPDLLQLRGRLGALSIVRFRTAIKEPLDIVFLFWSIAVGNVLAVGIIILLRYKRNPYKTGCSF